MRCPFKYGKKNWHKLWRDTGRMWLCQRGRSEGRGQLNISSIPHLKMVGGSHLVASHLHFFAYQHYLTSLLHIEKSLTKNMYNNDYINTLSNSARKSLALLKACKIAQCSQRFQFFFVCEASQTSTFTWPLMSNYS